MKVCFWGDNAGALMGRPIGGGELQIALLAKVLVKAGHEVVFVDFNISKDLVTPDGMKIFSVKGYNQGVRFLRFLNRLRCIFNSLKDQKADIYYCRIRDFRHILSFWASRRVKAKFILALASDLDVSGFGKRLKYFYLADVGGLWWFINAILSEIVYSFLLKRSDLILVQHSGQKNALSGKKINSIILNNLIDLNEIPFEKERVQNDFSYVGSLDKRKGFSEFYELVKLSPDITFKVIGSPRDKTGALLYDKIKSFTNVSLTGKLNHADTLHQISNSRALISTSPMEGFPNIFIEAWASGIPVLSLSVDPGNVIENEHLGFIAHGDIGLLAKEINNVNNTPEFAERSRSYVEKNHALDESRIEEISNLFLDLAAN
jgi:hypothetical protein